MEPKGSEWVGTDGKAMKLTSESSGPLDVNLNMVTNHERSTMKLASNGDSDGVRQNADHLSALGISSLRVSITLLQVMSGGDSWNYLQRGCSLNESLESRANIYTIFKKHQHRSLTL
jgi:hypothetical protein